MPAEILRSERFPAAGNGSHHISSKSTIRISEASKKPCPPFSYHPLFQNAAACEPALDEHGESDFDTPTERAIIDHYGLTPEDGWAIHRYSFPWKTKRRPKSISSFALTLTPQPVCVPGAEFEVQKPGDIFAFSHNGIPYTLTAQNFGAADAAEKRFFRRVVSIFQIDLPQ